MRFEVEMQLRGGHTVQTIRVTILEMSQLCYFLKFKFTIKGGSVHSFLTISVSRDLPITFLLPQAFLI